MTRDQHHGTRASTGRPEREPVQAWIWRRRLQTVGLLASGQVTPRQGVNGWVRSPSHCKVLTAPEANEVGIGVELDPETAWGFVWGSLPYPDGALP
jgi:hypothetical protein